MSRNVHTNLVLMEIAQGIKEIIANPDLSEKIKESYA